MAKAQTIKPKSSFADWFKRLGAPKPKPAARPGGGAQSSSTMTNLRAAEAPASRTGARSTTPRPKAMRSRWRGRRCAWATPA